MLTRVEVTDRECELRTYIFSVRRSVFPLAVWHTCVIILFIISGSEYTPVSQPVPYWTVSMGFNEALKPKESDRVPITASFYRVLE